MEQEIRINEITLSPPVGYQMDIAKLSKQLTAVFSKLFVVDEIEVTPLDDGYDTVAISCEGVNKDANVWLEEDEIGDPDCIYGTGTYRSLEYEGLVDEYDIKKALTDALPEWDITLENVEIEDESDIYEKEAKG